MDTTARRRKLHKFVVSDSLNHLYPHDLSFYQLPPGSSISLNEFEDLAVERLQLLRIIEQAALKNHKPFTDDWRQCIKDDLTKAGLKKYVRSMGGFSGNTDQDIQARRADHISHFILRLAYCRSEDLRRWFLTRELEWFRLKFSVQSHQSIKKFLQLNNLAYTAISDDEKLSIKEELLASTGGFFGGGTFETIEFYKVPFVEVCSLVRSRKTFLKSGDAYVASNDLVLCVLSHFRAKLNESLNFYHHRMSMFDDERISPLLENLHNMYTGKTYTIRNDKDNSIAPSELDASSKKHFPLCMRHIHEVLRANHHLKHGCRLQYGLFLKGIGLSYDDALEFWREEFTKIMDSGKFEKGYVYNIKHQYGKVGNMTNYSPHSCIKIIMYNVGPGEHHGCPFRHWDPAILKQKMIEYGFSSEGVEEVRELVANGHYQVACSKYFEIVHGKAPVTGGINHPNQYFEESVNLAKNKQK